MLIVLKWAIGDFLRILFVFDMMESGSSKKVCRFGG